ncbi:hypothetical protein INT45_003276 [Circinella minor]|uniref:Uncharacterized protein n=1 Tax=Circinella minor TaxID=1195481 RepID=A0A8H7SBB3_9FUNG|nr:hypothetical protein INT45_003276 [Circinella minor]
MSQQNSIEDNTLPYDPNTSLPHSIISNSDSNIEPTFTHDRNSSLSVLEHSDSVNNNSDQQQEQELNHHSQSEFNSTVINDRHHAAGSEGDSSLSQHVTPRNNYNNDRYGDTEDEEVDNPSQLSLTRQHDSLLVDENDHGSQNSFTTPLSPPSIKRNYTFPDENPTKFTPNYFAEKRGVKSEDMMPNDAGPVEPINTITTQRRCFNRRVQPYPTIRNPEPLTRQQVRRALGIITPPSPSITPESGSTPTSQPVSTNSRRTNNYPDDNTVMTSSLSSSSEEVEAYIASHPAIFLSTQPGTTSDEDDDDLNDANSDVGYNNYGDLDSD